MQYIVVTSGCLKKFHADRLLTSNMSRRLLQTLPRLVGAGTNLSLRSVLPRSHLPLPQNVSRSFGRVVVARNYATENPRGVPVNSEKDDPPLTPAENERNALHKQAQ
jgi:hypothetical protein